MHRYGSACPLDYLRSCCRALGLPTPCNVSARLCANDLARKRLTFQSIYPSPVRVGRLLRYLFVKVHPPRPNRVAACGVL